MSPKHVLVVDDDPMVLEIVERTLSAANFRVSKARRVAIAKDVLIRQTIDLIISDARIPGETGLHLAATAQQLGIAFILMSGDPGMGSRARHRVGPVSGQALRAAPSRQARSTSLPLNQA